MQDTLEPNLTIANESGNHVVDLQPLPFREKPCLAGANTVRALNRDLVIDRLREEKLPRVTVDFDGSVLSTRGHAEGSAIGYNRQRKGARSYYRYYPLFCTVAQTGQFLDLLHRPGNVHDSRDALAFIEANIEFVREIVGVREIETRMGWVIVPCTLGWPWTWSSGPRLHGGSPRTDSRATAVSTIPISNAHVERLLRVVSTFRKNSLFVGSLEAGRRALREPADRPAQLRARRRQPLRLPRRRHR